MFSFPCGHPTEGLAKILLLALIIAAPICGAPTTVAIASSANPSVFGQAITLSAYVNPPWVTGNVTFCDGVTTLGTAAITNGKATLSAILPTSGVRVLTARFLGNGAYEPSSTPALAQTVTVVPATTLQAPAGSSTANASSLTIAAADFNGDGHMDIVTANNTVLMGNGNGTFRAPVIYPSSSNSYKVVTGDFNGDGKPDFATAQVDGNIGIWLNKGDGTFQPPVPYSIGVGARDIALGDFNNDGIIDIAVASDQAQGVAVGILLGAGDGTFHPVVAYRSEERQMAIAVADFNGDGNADIVTAGNGGTILLGAGDGTFQIGRSYPAVLPQAVVIGDFNNDGHADFAVANTILNTIHVFLGNGDGTFHEPSVLPLTPGFFGTSLAVADFDGDGNQDIAWSGALGTTISVFLGRGNGTFRGAVNFPAGSNTGAIVAAEFNGDGRTDLAVTNPLSLEILLGGSGVFPTVTTTSVPAAMGGVPYSTVLGATGGTTPYTWSLSTQGLPLPLNPDGTIAGTPPATFSPSTTPFTVVVSGPDGPGFFSSQNLSFQLAAAFQIDASKLFVGYVGIPYESPYPERLIPSGGTPPYRNWKVTTGSPPPGVTLDPASGNFTGSPTAAGAFVFTVTVNDSGGLTSLPANVRILVEAIVPTQPLIVANAASATTYPVVAPGSYISIYGTALAGDGNPSAASLPLPTTLNGTQVTLGGIPMPLLYAASGQVNGLVPQALKPKLLYPLVVTEGTTQSEPLQLLISEFQPGIYAVNGSGSGPGVIANALTGQMIDGSNPAHPSDYLVIYCTGLGDVQGPNGEAPPVDGAAAPTNVLFRTTATVTATIGGLSAPVSFSGLTPSYAGLYQVNVQIPAAITSGGSVPVVIATTDSDTGATAQSNTVTIVLQ